jgi:nitrous oxide reductase accessory protein NosL
MKTRKLLAVAAFAILLAGCAAEHDPVTQQAGLPQSDVSRYVAAMSEQPGQLALKHQCGHERSWTRLEGLSTENE